MVVDAPKDNGSLAMNAAGAPFRGGELARPLLLPLVAVAGLEPATPGYEPGKLPLLHTAISQHFPSLTGSVQVTERTRQCW